MSAQPKFIGFSPRCYDAELAAQIGRTHASVFQQVNFLIHQGAEDIDGRPWARIPCGEIRDSLCGSISDRGLREVLIDLETQGLLERRRDLNSRPDDRTYWYAIDASKVYERFWPEAPVPQKVEQPRQPAEIAGGALEEAPKEPETEQWRQAAEIAGGSDDEAPKEPEVEQPRQAAEIAGGLDDVAEPPAEIAAGSEPEIEKVEQPRQPAETAASFKEENLIVLREEEEKKDKNKESYGVIEKQVKPVEDKADYSRMNAERPTYCLHFDTMQRCRHEVEALEAIKAVTGYTAGRHRNLHAFIHRHSVEALRTLYTWFVEQDDNRQHWHPGFVCGANADFNLQLAQEDVGDRAAKEAAKMCSHDKDQVIFDRDRSDFLCRKCNAILSEADAHARGVNRDDFDCDHRAFLGEIYKKLGVAFTMPHAGD